MRRRIDTLLPIELSIIEAALELRGEGAPSFHGFLMAKRIVDSSNARLLTAHGTLYRALDRLYRGGLLASEWEDPLLAAEQARPRRRLYSVTAAGEAALARLTMTSATKPAYKPGLAMPCTA